MKKSAILATASTLFLGFAANAWAGDLLGFPIMETQGRFYSLIIGLIAMSIVVVAVSYLFPRTVDIRKPVVEPSAGKSLRAIAATTR